jgi:hypothetical protein
MQNIPYFVRCSQAPCHIESQNLRAIAPKGRKLSLTFGKRGEMQKNEAVTTKKRV